MKKLKIGDPELIKILISKMLEKYEVDYDWVVANQNIDVKSWYSHFEWTLDESEEYRDWFVKFFQENVSPRKRRDYLFREWQWFNLMYGLKVKNEN